MSFRPQRRCWRAEGIRLFNTGFIQEGQLLFSLSLSPGTKTGIKINYEKILDSGLYKVLCWFYFQLTVLTVGRTRSVDDDFKCHSWSSTDPQHLVTRSPYIWLPAALTSGYLQPLHLVTCSTFDLVTCSSYIWSPAAFRYGYLLPLDLVTCSPCIWLPAALLIWLPAALTSGHL